MGARFISKASSFLGKNDALKDMIVAHMAQDIEVAIKTSAGTPVKTGDMKSWVRHEKIGEGRYRVRAEKEYSAVQEAGIRRGARPFSRYTTSGTSAGWFKRSIDSVSRNKVAYVQEAKKALNI